MATRIILIRHGETIWNRERRCQGSSDIPLSDIGQTQAEALAVALKNLPLAAVYSSDLVRARKTAEIVAAPHRLQVAQDARLRELNQGELEGDSLKDLLAGHPDLLKLWMNAPADVAMPGGESMRSLQARAVRAIDDIVRQHPDQTAAVVAHNLCNLAIVCHYLSLDLNRFRALRMDNASIAELEFSGRQTVLLRINDTHHLNDTHRLPNRRHSSS